MLSSLLSSAPTKNLERALVARDVDGVHSALRMGANVHALSVVLPGDSEPVEHPLEIALMNLLPLSVFEALANYGARVSNMEGGLSSIEEFFESVDENVKKAWPDHAQIKALLFSERLQEEPGAGSVIDSALGSVSSAAQSAATGLVSGAKEPFKMIGRTAKAASDLGKKTSESILDKFKKK